MWGATSAHRCAHRPGPDFNPRTPCGVRPGDGVMDRQGMKISIHAPRVGCDVMREGGVVIAKVFQSTHPVWGATANGDKDHRRQQISIHAPRVGCDVTFPMFAPSPSNFNPRTPCGVRLSTPVIHYQQVIFQSTHPVWGATSSSVGGPVRQ